jgi:hypothetical protein
MSATPALRALNVAVHDEWVATIAAHAAVMVGEDPEDRWPALFGECTVAAIATAIQRWWRDPAVVLGDEYDAVLDLLSPIDRPSVLVSRSTHDRAGSSLSDAQRTNTPSKNKENTPWKTD